MTDSVSNPQMLRALIVDDDSRWRAVVAELLSEIGWNITASATPPDDLGGYDLAVLDVSLDPLLASNRDGLKIMERITALGTPCILLSGLSRAELITAADRHPKVLGYLPKDAFRREVFIALVERASAERAPHQPTILVIEDDAGWRAIYEDVFSDTGYKLHTAASYAEARGWLQRSDLALAIVDLHLVSSAAPVDNRDGFWFLKAARQRNLPAIVVSALGAPEDIDRAYEEYGVFAFVEKEGFDRREFLRTVDSAIRSSGLASRPVTAPAETAAPDAEAAALLRELTEREREVLEELVKGRTNREISEQLGITPNTVKKHVDHILQKLQVSTRAGAVAVAMRAGVN